MTLKTEPSAMRRKAGAGRPPPEIGAPTPAKLLRAALGQAAQDVAALALAAGTVAEARTTLARFVEALPGQALLALVEGPDGRFGLLALDPQAVAALVEVQTTGRVAARPAEARPPTRTDAILCADFIDRALELFELRVAEAGLALAPALAGFRYAMALAEPAAIAMTLEDIPYREFAAPLDLGRGAKAGALRLILPFAPPGRAGAGADAGFGPALRGQVMGVEARLTATLARRRMTLAEVRRLAVGSLLVIPAEALAQVAVEDLAGRVVMRGRLGQSGGHRAVRLSQASQAALAGPGAPAAAPRPRAAVAAPPAPAGALPPPGPAGLPPLDGLDFDFAALDDAPG